jgi:phospholipid/cholesterol/gamma-HCH transport system permease protein
MGLVVEARGSAQALVLSGEIDSATAGELWAHVVHEAAAARRRALILDVSGVSSWDTAGTALLLAAERAHGGKVALEGASAEVTAALEVLRHAKPPEVAPVDPLDWLYRGLAALPHGIAFIGEAVVAAARLPGRPRLFRVGDMVRYADEAGVRGLPLAVLLGFLIGLILAFQSLVPMRRFGADLYVANLVAVSLLRELGPLLAAVILAGRTGSAFAAEIGTMKVNQEVDALVTLDLDPMTFLVLPRMAAALLVMPALTVVLELAGLVGMSVVLVSAGIPLTAISRQVTSWVGPGDAIGGLAKAMVFGMVVAGIGCASGLSTGTGPRAVGQSATAAVVGGIVATVLLDGLFSVVFYRLGW